MNKGKFVLGTLLGAAAGVVAGILTAPQSGKETRDDLKTKAAELKEEAARRANSMKRENKDTVGSIKQKADRALHRGRHAVHDDGDETSDI